MEDQLLFVIGSPRSGTTMLQRLLGSHSAIFTHPEPHLMTPLAHLGYYDTVDKAPFDHINAAKAIVEFVDELPNREDDYLDAVRAYTDTLYGRMLATSDCRYFLDKTPAYALITDFIAKVYPKAHYIVLTRHPLAVLSSYANSFFDGNYAAAYDFNPILDRYVPAIARFLRDTDVPKVHVRYEDLVEDPDGQMSEVFAFLGLEHEPDAIEYGKHKHIKKSFGDPNVDSQSRPTTRSVAKWKAELANNPEARKMAEAIVAGLDGHDVATLGYDKATFFDDLHGEGGKTPRKRINAYRVQRRVLLKLRTNIHENQFGRAVKAVRYYCDVLLRD